MQVRPIDSPSPADPRSSSINFLRCAFSIRLSRKHDESVKAPPKPRTLWKRRVGSTSTSGSFTDVFVLHGSTSRWLNLSSPPVTQALTFGEVVAICPHDGIPRLQANDAATAVARLKKTRRSLASKFLFI